MKRNNNKNVKRIGRISRHEDRPIFIHSSFRTSSTWLWSKVRSSDNVMAYYEIFNEGLNTLTAQAIGENNYSSWQSKHPPAGPYFMEFLPLLRPEGGVAGFDPEMHLARCIPREGPDGSLAANEILYVQQLISHASHSGQRAVLTCTRSLGRVHALRRAFDGVHIVVYRNLLHQWASYSAQALAGNMYFIDCTDKVIRLNRHDKFICAIDDFFHVREVSPYNENMFLAFVALHFYLYAIAASSCDMIVDVTKCAERKKHRLRTERALGKLLKLKIDISDATPAFGTSVVNISNASLVSDILRQFALFADRQVDSPKSSQFLKGVLKTTLQDISRYEFLTKGLQTFALQQGRDLTERARVAESMRDAATAQMSEETEARLGTERRLAELSAERDGLAAQFSDAQAGRANAEHRMAELSAERDGLAAQFSDAHAGRANAEHRMAELVAERDGLAAQLSDAQAGRANAEHRMAELVAERDGLVAQLEVLQRQAAEPAKPPEATPG